MIQKNQLFPNGFTRSGQGFGFAVERKGEHITSIVLCADDEINSHSLNKTDFFFNDDIGELNKIDLRNLHFRPYVSYTIYIDKELKIKRSNDIDYDDFVVYQFMPREHDIVRGGNGAIGKISSSSQIFDKGIEIYTRNNRDKLVSVQEDISREFLDLLDGIEIGIAYTEEEIELAPIHVGGFTEDKLCFIIDDDTNKLSVVLNNDNDENVYLHDNKEKDLLLFDKLINKYWYSLDDNIEGGHPKEKKFIGLLSKDYSDIWNEVDWEKDIELVKRIRGNCYILNNPDDIEKTKDILEHMPEDITPIIYSENKDILSLTDWECHLEDDKVIFINRDKRIETVLDDLSQSSSILFETNTDLDQWLEKSTNNIDTTYRILEHKEDLVLEENFIQYGEEDPIFTEDTMNVFFTERQSSFTLSLFRDFEILYASEVKYFKLILKSNEDIIMTLETDTGKWIEEFTCSREEMELEISANVLAGSKSITYHVTSEKDTELEIKPIIRLRKSTNVRY